MRWSASLAVVLAVAGALQAAGGKAPAGPSQARPKVYAVVFDLTGGAVGKSVADRVRIRLRRHKEYDVLDRLTTQEASGPVAAETAGPKARALLKRLACEVGIYGTVEKKGRTVRVRACVIDLRKGAERPGWTQDFTDATERAEGLVARRIVEALRGEAEWKPPEVGDEDEPAKFGKPLNRNGDFESGHAPWDAPDNVATFLEKGPPGRGTVLRMRTDIARDPWIAYRRKLRFGQADAKNPPKIGRDTSYGCVGGLEGVHFRGEWIKAVPGQRYWLTADKKGGGGAKIFIKGFKDWSGQADGLSESSLARQGITPKQYADLSEAEKKKLIAADIKANPQVHRRECYRWYLNAGSSGKDWKHFALPFPPRGGLAANVQWLQIQIYVYWPPGEYFWDNVHLYKDPRQKAPLPEEKPRTPNVDKR